MAIKGLLATLGFLFFFAVDVFSRETETGNRFACIVNSKNSTKVFPLSEKEASKLQGSWHRLRDLGLDAKDIAAPLTLNEKVFLLGQYERSPIEACERKIVELIPYELRYVSSLREIKAYQCSSPRCSGHRLAYFDEKDKKIRALYRNERQVLKARLKQYNFNVVIEGMLYRSGKLGKDGIEDLAEVFTQEGLRPIKSIASIHVMGFGGVGGSYNLDELKESQRRGISFLHSYHPDSKKTVYMDGIDPSRIESSSHRGNIYSPETLDRYVPSEVVRRQLGIDQSLEKERYLEGNTKDFLHSVINILDAPWPLLIHCKGGKHKTGMISLIFEYLLDESALDAELTNQVRVSHYKNRVASWYLGHAGFMQIFSGPMISSEALRHAEHTYLNHNLNVFRKENIEFIRKLIDRDIHKDKLIAKYWQIIRRKFEQKRRSMNAIEGA